MGPTLVDIKADDSMIPLFADAAAKMICQVFGEKLSPDSWAIVTAPRRRHKERNFATLVCERLAGKIGLPFFPDCAFSKSRMRVGAEFEPGNIPPQTNIIVFDDFVTTGSTLTSMKNLLEPLGKTTVFFAGVDNKL